MLIPRYHWALTKPRYEKGVLTGIYNNTWPENLRLEPICSPTFEELRPLMAKMSEKWGWDQQGRYNEEALRKTLAQPGTKLYLLRDTTESEPVIGYALVSKPPEEKISRFWGRANDVNVLEIDNLGLFPNKEGGGRGKSFFEKIFADHFPNNDIVYWSQHDTHSPTLARFYRERMQMELLDTDRVPDFRHKAQVA